MLWKAVRKFNGAVDPYWSTPAGIEEWGGYATFDEHMGAGLFSDPNFAARKFIEESKGVARTLGKMDEYNEAMRLFLNPPSSREIRFIFNQDVFEISPVTGSDDLGIGVRNFHDPRLQISFNETGRIVRTLNGKMQVRRGWRWVSV